MARCPVKGCNERFRAKGLERHITVAHPEYRKAHPLVHEEKEALVIELNEMPSTDRTNALDSVLDDLMINLNEPIKIPLEVKTRKLKSESKLPEETHKKSLLNKLSGIFVEQVEEEPKKKARKIKPKVESTELGVSSDLEATYDMLYRMPILLIMFGLFMFAWMKWDTIMAWGNNPFVEFYAFLIMNISEPISIIILSLTGLMMFLFGTIIYKVVWRIMFPDLQLKSYKEIPVLGKDKDGNLAQLYTKKIFIPPTRRGRIYLMVGRGFWDRKYRKRTGKPRPAIVTIYFRDFAKRKNPFANPFKVLASCEKGYLNDPDGTRLQKDGLFRRTLIATHMRRDTENDSAIWWFENEPYDRRAFQSDPYTSKHSLLIETGLGKVSEACGMDSSIQKDQMRNSVSYLPKQLIMEDKEMTELKKRIMEK